MPGIYFVTYTHGHTEPVLLENFNTSSQTVTFKQDRGGDATVTLAEKPPPKPRKAVKSKAATKKPASKKAPAKKPSAKKSSAKKAK